MKMSVRSAPLAAIVAAGALVTASAMLSSSASADLVSYKCGAPIRSIIKTEDNGKFVTNSQTYVDVSGAGATITVPTGETRCVKVRFSATVTCSETVGNDWCSIRAVEPGGVILDPSGVYIASEHKDYESHGFEFVTRLAEGSHTIRVQAAVFEPSTVFSIPAWTFDVEQLR